MKICSICKQPKTEDEFSRKRTNKRTGEIVLQYHCKKCQSEYSKSHYHANKKKYLRKASTRNKIVKEERILFLIEYFKSHPCVDCGETNPIVLEFDHVRGNKSSEITKLLYSSTFDTLLKEIDKCDVRCANCHRKRTAIQNKWRMLELI